MDKEVSVYIDKQKSPQKGICKKLRSIILKAIPKAKEEMKFGVPWFEVCYIVALKDHVNLGFCLEGLSKEEKDSLKGSGKTMRHLQFRDKQEIDEKKIKDLLKKVWSRSWKNQ